MLPIKSNLSSACRRPNPVMPRQSQTHTVTYQPSAAVPHNILYIASR